MQTKEYTSKYMHIYIKHPQACIHVYKHRRIGFPQLHNHWWMKHYFQQSFVSRLNVSQHWYTDTPTSSPLCFLPTRTITMSIHNPPRTQTHTLVNRELICSYLPCQTPHSDRGKRCSRTPLTYTFIYILLGHGEHSAAIFSTHFRNLNTLVVKDIYTNTSKHTAGANGNSSANANLQGLHDLALFWWDLPV